VTRYSYPVAGAEEIKQLQLMVMVVLQVPSGLFSIISLSEILLNLKPGIRSLPVTDSDSVSTSSQMADNTKIIRPPLWNPGSVEKNQSPFLLVPTIPIATVTMPKTVCTINTWILPVLAPALVVDLNVRMIISL